MKKMMKWTPALALVIVLLLAAFPAQAETVKTDQVDIKINIQGTPPETAENFVVRMTPVNGGPLPAGAQDGHYDLTIPGPASASSAATGKLPSITFSKLGIYQYTLTQLPGSQSGATYDNKVYQLKITIWHDEANQWDASMALRIQGEEEGTKYPDMAFLNKYAEETTSVTVRKVWVDSNDQDGIRPNAVTATLSTGQKVTLNAANKWTATIDNLPRFETGTRKEIKYTWTENNVPAGYTLTTAVNGAITTLTNTHTPETIDINGAKTWIDDNNSDGLRPRTITINLLANGKVVNSRTVTSNGNRWTYAFTGLPRYAEGREIVYTVTENAVPGYTTQVNGYNIINTHQKETVTIRGEKVWDDNNDREGRRPQHVTINLLADGVLAASQTVTGNGSRWTYSFPDLPKYNDKGREIVYTVNENPEEGYKTQVNGTTITNKLLRRYTLTIYYQYLDGSTAAPTFFEIHNEGDKYDVPSPVIPGYRATILRVTGTQPARNIEYVVIYIPNKNPNDPEDTPRVIDEYTTPLGLGNINLHAGDCFE